MNEITLKSYAKVNLSLDIVGRRDDGYHNISSLMQDVDLCDVVEIKKCSQSGTKYKPFHCEMGSVVVHLCTNNDTIPLDEGNLAIKGAKVILKYLEEKGMTNRLGSNDVSIFLEKHLPIAAGIAGGSGNAAAVLLGINALAGNFLSLRELMEIGVRVGADVPFSLMMNACKNREVLAELEGIREARSSAWVSGIGEIVEPADPVHRYVIMANPGVLVSTAEVYDGIDAMMDYRDDGGLFTNQLEPYVLAEFKEAAVLKAAMQERLKADCVLMSGSGPTMVAYYTDEEVARADFELMSNADWRSESWRMWYSECGCD